MNESLTAMLSCYVRAYHSFRPQPVLRDPLAARLLSPAEQAAIAEALLRQAQVSEPDVSGASDELLVRMLNRLEPQVLAQAVFCEASLRRAMRFHCRQYLILRAGLDTFAWRNPFPQLRVFELDGPEQTAEKRRRLAQAGLPEDRAVLVACDLTQANWTEALRRSGFRSDVHTLCSLPGLSRALSRQQFRTLLCRLSELLPRGSEIVLDYRAGFGEAGSYSPWELEVLLGECGFLAYEHLNSGELTAQYFSAAPDLRVPEGLGCCLAVKKEHRR